MFALVLVLILFAAIMAADFLWGDYLLASRRPRLKCQRVQDASRLIIVVDGFLGDSFYRMQQLSDTFNCDVPSSVVYVRTHGWRYDFGLWVDTIVAKITLERPSYEQIVVIGGSLGAKVAHEAVRRAEAKGVRVDGLLLLDPLFGPEGAKIPLGRWLDAIKACPGVLTSVIWDWLFTIAVIGKLPWRYSPHQRAGVLMPVSFLAEQARCANRPPVGGKVRAPVAIVHTPEADDDVLHPSEVTGWRERYPSASVLTPQPSATGHMGLDVDPDAWRWPICRALRNIMHPW